MITASHIEKGYSYKSFRNRLDNLLAEGPSSDGNSAKLPFFEYTKTNIKKIDHLDKTVALMYELNEEMQKLSEKWIWIVLAEGWCDDVAQNLPVIAKIAEITENIELKILLRDENPAIMDNYLTDGGRAIPKLICLRADTMREKGTWGPRPEPVQKMMMELKEKKEKSTDPKALVKQYHHTMRQWYDKDKSQTIQKEFLHIVRHWKMKH